MAGRTALHFAALQADPRVARILLDHSTDQLMAQDNDGSTPISLAVRYGHIATVQQMLLSSEQLNSESKSGVGVRMFERAGAALPCYDGRSTLVWASQNGHAEVLSLLLTAQASLGVATVTEKGDALHSAAQGGHVGCVETLLHIRANVDNKDSDGWTALMLAATEGHGHVCALLIRAQAAVFLTNHDGMTAADLAEREGHDHILPLLTRVLSSTSRMGESCLSPIVRRDINMDVL